MKQVVENKAEKKRFKVRHRVETAYKNKILIKLDEVKRYVIENLRVGERLSAPHDAYNTDIERRKIFSRRTVVDFYPNFILTEDCFGKRETYQYFEAFELMNGGKKK